jgi:hypothetical protein
LVVERRLVQRQARHEVQAMKGNCQQDVRPNDDRVGQIAFGGGCTVNRGTMPSVLSGCGTAGFASRDDCFYIEVCAGAAV